MTTKDQSATQDVSASTPSPAASRNQEILVPIDFSPASVKALHYAAGLAARDHAHLTLLNVVEEPESFRRLDLENRHRREHLARARQLEELARRELDPQSSPRLLVRDGRAPEEIRRAAGEAHASLIVMGRHARHGLQRLMHHGHTASRVAEGAPCPVLVLAEDEPAPAVHTLTA